MEQSEKRFGFIIDGELFHVMHLPDDEPFQKTIAGMQSFPMVIDITDYPHVQGGGWKFENNEFYRDKDAVVEGPGYELDD
jgi:hypothetical protein